MRIQPLSRHRSALIRNATAALAVLCTAPLAAAGSDLDIQILGTPIAQVLQKNTAQLTAGRSTMVRVAIRANGTVIPGTEVDALLRVFVDGVEAPESPLYSVNGPIVPPAAPNPADLSQTLNFVFLAPESDDVVFTAEVNPAGPGQTFEIDYANNTASTPTQSFVCRRVPELVYVPIDLRPNGETEPNLPPLDLIEPGVGDGFLQGIYASKDWSYHRSVAPSKLWTSSVASTGQNLNSSLASDLALMIPQPDKIYGWIPGGVGYNGQALGIPGVAAMGNTQQIRHQRTFAHEIGHLFGLSHITVGLGTYGIDVEHHLNLTQGLGQLKIGTLNDVMTAGLLTEDAWVYPDNHEYFHNHSIFQCTTDTAVPADYLLVAGLWNRTDDVAQFTEAVTFTGERASVGVPLDRADLVVVATGPDGQVQVGVSVAGTAEACSHSEATPHPDHELFAFNVTLPNTIDPRTVENVSVFNRLSGAEVARLERSAHAPTLSIDSPVADATLEDTLRVAWRGADADGDDLRYYVRYSPDGVQRVPLASNLTAEELTLDMLPLPRVVSGTGFFEVLASDGLQTTTVRTGGLHNGQLLAGLPNAPFVHVMTPDDGKSFPFASTVLLHSSGWDIEDLDLDGGSIVWTSDLDGPIGFGRLTSTASLSVGTHVLTVTATDTSGNSSFDTTSITITDRQLPGGPPICQLDLGFGGPGNGILQVCGADLSAGTSSNLLLFNATPSEPVIIVYSNSSNPSPFATGTLVPVPILGIALGVTDPIGQFGFTILSNGGPLTAYAQAVYQDLGVPSGIALSNAVQLDVLP